MQFLALEWRGFIGWQGGSKVGCPIAFAINITGESEILPQELFQDGKNQFEYIIGGSVFLFGEYIDSFKSLHWQFGCHDVPGNHSVAG